MAIRAYPDYYLSRSRKILGSVFELALSQESVPPERFEEVFSESPYSDVFGRGSPKYNGGMSPQELLSFILGREVVRENPPVFGREYWAGFALAHVQWHLDTTFSRLFSVMTLSELLALYDPYHEADLSKLVDVFDRRLHPVPTLTALRRKRGLSRGQLSILSGVGPSTIGAYERGEQDLVNARGETIMRLSRALGCTIEELLH
ncbi:MAG: helix-turn-helix domain-containing protein [archaeon]|nr:helix-turn-helix domain-containing protein [archaeon]